MTSGLEQGVIYHNRYINKMLNNLKNVPTNNIVIL